MLGEIAGELAVDALPTKGAGKVAKLNKTAELLRGTKIGEQILSKADEAATAAKAGLAATFSDEAAAVASQRIKQKLATQLYAGIPADLLAEMAVVAGNKIVKGVKNFAEFSQQMVQEFGEKVRPELRKLFDQAVDKVTGGRRDVDVHELLGGHTIEKHVGKNEKWLRERLEKETDLRSVSTFYIKEVANRAQMQFVREFGKEIDDWAKNSASDFPTSRVIEMSEPVGSVVTRGRSGMQASSKVEVRVVKDTTEREVGIS